MRYTFVEESLLILKSLKGRSRLSSPLQDGILTLMKELRFLKSYLIYRETAGPLNWPRSFSAVEEAFRKSTAELSSAWRLPDVADKVEPVLSDMLESVKICKPEIGKDYALLWEQQAFRSKFREDTEYLRNLVDSVLENLEDLLISKGLVGVLKKKFGSLKEKLSFFGKSLPNLTESSYIPKEKIKSFLDHVYMATICAACSSYLCWVDDETYVVDSHEMDIKLSDLLHKIKPCSSQDIGMYARLLKASAATKGSEDDQTDQQVANFVKSLLENSMDSHGHQIDPLHKELEYLIAFFLDIPDNPTADLFWISKDIIAAATKAGSFHVNDAALIEDQLSNLLRDIHLLKSRVFVRQLDDSRDGLMVPMKDKLEPLVHVLKFLQKFAFDLPGKIQEEEKLLLSHAGIVSGEVTSLIDSIHKTRLTKETVMKMKLSISWLLPKISLINTEIKLMVLISHKANRISPMLDQIQSLHKELTFLRKFLMYTMNIEDQKLLLTHLEVVDIWSLSLISSFSEFEMTTEPSLSLPRLLRYIKLIKAEVILAELQTHWVGLVVHMKDQVKKLSQELGFFITFLFDPSWMYEQEKGLILKKSEAVADEAASLIFLFNDNVMKEKMAIELSKLIEKLVLLKANIKEIYLEIPESLHSNLPKINGLFLIDSLLGDMRELLFSKPISSSIMKYFIEMLCSEFEFLKDFLQYSADQQKDDEELKDLWTYISHVVYEAEYIIDSFVVKGDPVWHFMLWVYFAMEDIAFAREKVMEIYEENKYRTGFHIVTKTSSHVPLAPRGRALDPIFVGLEDDKYNIIDRLMRGANRLDIISVVDKSGLVKTTLFEEVYNDPSIINLFYIRAWCRLSQVYEPRETLLNILSQIEVNSSSIHLLSFEDLQLRLYRSLKGIRYLVVFEGLWGITLLNELKNSFPDDKNRSRILVAFRMLNMVCQAQLDCDVHHLRGFSDVESWNLLVKLAIYPDACPPTFQEVGMQISSYCRGQPIVISVVGGLLANTERKLDWWKQVAKNLSYGNFTADPYMHVLEFCYEQLPPHLKLFFLYFAAFPVGKEIPVRKLLWLWIAERFVLKNKSQMLEDVAEGYLLNLINRNLVVVAKKRSDGGVKACFIHDLLRDLCIAKAKEEKFMQLVQQFDEFSTTYRDDLHNGAESDYRSNPFKFECHRLCICSIRNHSVMLVPSDPCVRCLLFAASDDGSPRRPYDIPFISQNFQLLTILNMEGVSVDYPLPTELKVLVLLRYLAVTGDIHAVPSWITNLSKLETFILTGRQRVELPNTFWSMRKLRHVHIKLLASFSLQNCGELENSSELEAIQTLSSLVLCCGKHSEQIMRRLRKLRKLKCIFGDTLGCLLDSNEDFDWEFLTHLESLNATCLDGIRFPWENFYLLCNLEKLTLSEFRLPWGAISTLTMLPDLKVLKLRDRAFVGEEWITGEEEFPNLRYLKLDTLDIVKWSAGYFSFPRLQQLVLQRCEQLDSVPSGLAAIKTLQSIEVHWCSHSAAKSALEILEKQRYMGNEELVVLIHPQNIRGDRAKY